MAAGGALAAICFLGHFNRVSMAVAADLEIMPEYGISPTQMGFVYSAFLFAYALAMIPGGWLIDEHGPRFALAAMCMLSALFVALTGVVGLVTATAAAALAALFLVRGIMGAVSAPMHPGAANAIALGIPLQGRSTANGIVTGAALLGVASTFVVFGKLVEWFGWPVAFLEVAIVTIALGELWRYGAGDSVRARPYPKPCRRRQLTNFPISRSFSLCGKTKTSSLDPQLCLRGLLSVPVLLLDALLLRRRAPARQRAGQVVRSDSPVGHGGGHAAWRMAVGSPDDALSAGAPLAGIWRLSPWAASAGLLLLGIRASDPAWIVTWLSLALGVLGMAEGPFWVTAVEVGRGRGGFSAGVFNTGGNAGGILAPVITPWVSDTLGYGWEAGIGLGSAVGLFGAVLWLGIDPTNDDLVEVALTPDNPEPQLAPGPTP